MSSLVRSIVRSALTFALLAVSTGTLQARAAAATDPVLDAGALSQLESRAEGAQPKEQCFLYAELVHHLTEIAGKQLADGDTDHASATLKHIDSLAAKIHILLARDTKRLKNAELLLHYTTRRLADMVHVASSDDREVLQSTLKRLDTVQSELLTQVFAH